MAVNKNFVVKNGIEVATDVIYATSDLNKVGIGSTIPASTLDVKGGVAAVDGSFSGIVTTGNLQVGTGGTVIMTTGIGSVGIGTAAPDYLVDIRSPVSTGQTALYVEGDVRITGDINVDDITFDDATVESLLVTGISTLGSSGGGGVLITPGLGAGATVGNANPTGIVTYYGDGAGLVNVGVSLGLAIALGG